MLPSWPEAIIHCDADAFYVSCELTRHPELKGKPLVVLGKLGACILSKSYDLKARGVKTGMPIWEAKKIASDLIALPADFDLYNTMSAQMFTILQHWTPAVEVYSVDEAFLDMKGFRRLYKCDYPQMAHAIKDDIKGKLGITASMGVSVTKTLAKMAAEIHKPDGVTIISGKEILRWLPQFSVSDVPGFGRNTVPLLHKFGIRTCADFVKLSEDTVRSLLHRPGVDLWKELQGIKVSKVERTLAPNKSITRTSSFAPLTSDQHFLWAHTVRQLERAVEALHDEKLLAREIALYLRDKNFQGYAWSIRLPTATKTFSVLLEGLKELWREHFPARRAKSSLRKEFRSTGVTLLRLSPDTGVQFTLFEDPGMIVRRENLEQSKEKIKQRYGTLAIRSASSLRLKMLGPSKKKTLKAKAFNVDW